MADSGGPSLEGTKADAVRLHDDKQSYTGVHARGGPEPVPKGYGHVPSLSNLRRDSKEARRPSLSRTGSGAGCVLPSLLAERLPERKLSTSSLSSHLASEEIGGASGEDRAPRAFCGHP